MREHELAGAKQLARLGRKSKAPSGPVCPLEVVYLWRWFCQLARGLEINGMAPPGVSWQSLRAWSAQMRIELEPWEALALVRLGELRAGIIMDDK